MLNKVFGYLFFLILTFWLSIRSKPSEIQPNDRTFPQNICSISPELVSISNRLCCLWSSTRDNTLRKSTFPLMSNHRYGLQFNIANSNLHLLLRILLAGDIATNPQTVDLPATQHHYDAFPLMLKASEATTLLLVI